MGHIYCLRNNVNGKGYVGQHAGPDVEKRWKQHLWWAKRGSPHPLHRAIRKYGWENFSKGVVWTGDPTRLNDLETKNIAELGTFAGDGNGYNLTRGGGSNYGWVPTAETRANMSKAQKAAYIADPTPWIKTGAAQRGRTHTEERRLRTGAGVHAAHERDPELRWRIAEKNRGYKHTDEAKLAISVFNKGKKLTAEHCEAIAASKLGKPRSAETCEKMSKAKLGQRHSADACGRISIGVTEMWAAHNEQIFQEKILTACGRT